MWRTKMLAIASGLVAGAFLFFRYYQQNPGVFGSYTWNGQWYQAALLLCGLGLAGVFPAAWLWATVSLSLGAYLGTCLQGYLANSYGSHIPWSPFLEALIFQGPVSLPAPLIGGASGRLLNRARMPRFFYFALLTTGFALGGFLPAIDKVQRHRIETQELPAILRRIYQAEMAYSASRPDRSFMCDVTGFSKVGGWRAGDQPWYIGQRQYDVGFGCDDLDSHSFWVTAYSLPYGTAQHFAMYIDDTGELLAGQPAVDTARRHRFETQVLPTLLKRIYEAEIAYSAGQPDKSFTCDASQLPALRKMRRRSAWLHTELEPLSFGSSQYVIAIDCPGPVSPHSFQATARTARSYTRFGAPPDFSLSIDEAGKLTVPGDSKAQASDAQAKPTPRK